MPHGWVTGRRGVNASWVGDGSAGRECLMGGSSGRACLLGGSLDAGI